MNVNGHRLCWMLVATALGAVPGPSPAAAPPITAIEQAIETDAASLSLPSGGIGTLSVTPCSTCKPRSLLAGAATQWFIGARSVDFAEWRNSLASNPRAPALLLYRHGGTEITRAFIYVQTR